MAERNTKAITYQEVTMDVLADISGVHEDISDYKKDMYKWLADSLAVYRREFDKKKLFYDKTDVWYDYEFEYKIRNL